MCFSFILLWQIFIVAKFLWHYLSLFIFLWTQAYQDTQRVVGSENGVLSQQVTSLSCEIIARSLGHSYNKWQICHPLLLKHREQRVSQLYVDLCADKFLNKISVKKLKIYYLSERAITQVGFYIYEWARLPCAILLSTVLLVKRNIEGNVPYCTALNDLKVNTGCTLYWKQSTKPRVIIG